MFDLCLPPNASSVAVLYPRKCAVVFSQRVPFCERLVDESLFDNITFGRFLMCNVSCVGVFWSRVSLAFCMGIDGGWSIAK